MWMKKNPNGPFGKKDKVPGAKPQQVQKDKERSTFLSRMIKRWNVKSLIMIALEGEGKGPKNAECEKVFKGKYPRGQEARRQRTKWPVTNGKSLVEIHVPSPLQMREESALTLPVRLISRYTSWTGMNECCMQHLPNLSVPWSIVWNRVS